MFVQLLRSKDSLVDKYATVRAVQNMTRDGREFAFEVICAHDASDINTQSANNLLKGAGLS